MAHNCVCMAIVEGRIRSLSVRILSNHTQPVSFGELRRTATKLTRGPRLPPYPGPTSNRTIQAPSAYNFGNPDGVLGYNDEYVFYYPGPDLHAAPGYPVDMCPTLPFSCYLREHIGPMSYEQAMASVFPGMGSAFTYSGDWNGGTSSGFDTNDVSAFLQTPITVVGPDRTSLTVQGVNELITFFKMATLGAYAVSGNSHEQLADAVNPGDSAFHAIYEHDSSDPAWREKLMHILSESVVVSEPLTASLDGSN